MLAKINLINKRLYGHNEAKQISLISIMPYVAKTYVTNNISEYIWWEIKTCAGRIIKWFYNTCWGKQKTSCLPQHIFLYESRE
jgi:hypothetical protein